jgi:hypothetical protein
MILCREARRLQCHYRVDLVRVTAAAAGQRHVDFDAMNAAWGSPLAIRCLAAACAHTAIRPLTVTAIGVTP